MSNAERLSGSVQSQGIRVGIKEWLDMGSIEWKNTPDEIKSAAYQAAKLCGWTDEGIFAVMTCEFSPRVDEFHAHYTIDLLKELAILHPFEITQGENNG